MNRRWLSLIVVILAMATAPVWALELTLSDPAGDDDGPGTYLYPTDRVYTPGSFDLLKLSIEDQGSYYIFKVSLGAKLENPWEMDSGFSIQMAQIYIDADGQSGSGNSMALPGMNARFQIGHEWEKAIIVSPQPASRLKTEVTAKAAAMAGDVVIPLKVTPRGKTIIATVEKKDLQLDLTKSMGYQILISSNEGFPSATEILSRRVNEYEGQHRFGGGSDYDGDPHFMDILWPPADGSEAEIDGQHACLSNYVSADDPAKNQYATIPMVRPGSATPAGEPVAEIPPRQSADDESREDTRIVVFRTPAPAPVQAIHAGEFGMTWNGKIYTSWLYGNDDTQHSVYVDPFGDGGHNGTNSELELEVSARVSDYVEAGARIKNRFRKNYWATYWNNENLDEAQYMKLRGVWVRFKPPEWLQPFVETIHVGSSDLGMFNPWTVGRIRYIDRDNCMGTFISGRIGSVFSYDMGRISLPQPWAGPGWTTSGKGYVSADGFFNRDFAFAAAMNFDVHDRFRFRLVGDYTIDREGDPEDENERDGRDNTTRYENTVISGEFEAAPAEFMDISGVIAYADSNYRALFDYLDKKGANPIPQKDVDDIAMKCLLELTDPFGIGLNFAVEYFNIGDDFVTLMGARRESDVLLTEGFESDDAVGAFDWGGWWGTMGQVPSLNIDNNETQFDETCYQTIVGWKGETFLASYERGAFDVSAEYTLIDYNTNMQNRDMSVYWDGGGYGAPANAYNENQDRDTRIAVLKGGFNFKAGRQWDVKFRVKNIDDQDLRDTSSSEDDYSNDKWVYDISLGCQVFDELYLRGGYTIYDKEITLGDHRYDSEKNRLYLITQYEFGGVRIGYAIEKFTGEDWAGDWETGDLSRYNDWDLVRSHAFLEVAF